MKLFAYTILFFLLAIAGMQSAHAQSESGVLGAWRSVNGADTSIMLITPGYFTVTVFNASGFQSTMGGTWEGASDNAATTTIEFNSADKSQVGKHPDATASFEGGQLVSSLGDQQTTWTRIDDGSGPMAGVWQITARESNGEMREMKRGARKTIKVLTGTRFQWAAINTETGEFFGTGGGTYTFENGVYTENIDFFSRDNSRVGASLSFKGSVEGSKWDHSGKSSKGDPIHEVWTKM
ncbi:membrane or secreted protein [Chitinophaga japonensis]|uniref:Membrane or secreted protein n=1 Tax=Chitinophaga japonensis TaxID=104662 RepID=A0A562ST79_CHIJA|nr:membrane or secreted protein [Chitinophaga japonensis]TWI84451.1 hypothetical protein LX66_4821 [Chitinophaga japonensis]